MLHRSYTSRSLTLRLLLLGLVADISALTLHHIAGSATAASGAALPTSASITSTFGGSLTTRARSAQRISVPRASASAKKKVVITGIGVVSALGSQGGGKSEFWEALLDGKSGIGPIESFDASRFPTTIGAEVKGFEPKEWFDNGKTVRSTDRFTHMTVAACKLALADAHLDVKGIDSQRLGIVVGSAFGGMETFEKQVLNLDAGKKVSPFTIPALLSNTASGIAAIEIGAQGPNFGVNSACAAGSHAIGESLRFLQNGDADMMLSGGAEAPLTPLSYAGFSAMKAMCSNGNDNPQQASRPFDKDRSGFVMGEGAGVLLGVRGAREGARRDHLLRACGVRGDVRRTSHHHPSP